MALNKRHLSLSLYLLFSIFAIAQNNANFNPNDTITYNDSNSEKVVALGNLIESSVLNNQSEPFVGKLYKNALLKRILQDNTTSDLNSDYLKSFVKGIKQGLDLFPQEIITEVENGAYYDFVNYRYDQNLQTYYILFRLYSAEGGLNYHDYRIHKKDSEMLISDIYLYLAGENITTTMSRLMTYVAPNKKILGLIETTKDEGVTELFQAIQYKKSGNFELAYKLMDGITSKLSKEKFFLIFKSLMASNIDDEKYLATLKELIETHKDDPTIVLNKIDYYIYKEDYFEAIQVINQLQEDTEDDFLNFLKANVAFYDENYDFALNNYKYIVDNYPDFFEGQAGYLSTLVMMNNFKDATSFISTLISEGYDRADIINYVEEDDDNGENILEVLVQSEPYKAWKLKTSN